MLALRKVLKYSVRVKTAYANSRGSVYSFIDPGPRGLRWNIAFAQ